MIREFEGVMREDRERKLKDVQFRIAELWLVSNDQEREIVKKEIHDCIKRVMRADE